MGGEHRAVNYLAAHSVCNNCRWFYGPEEFQWILELGVFMRTQVEKPTRIGQVAVKEFLKHEHKRDKRHVKSYPERDWG
jgi:hypothetical protein